MRALAQCSTSCRSSGPRRLPTATGSSVWSGSCAGLCALRWRVRRASTKVHPILHRSEEHTSELQSLRHLVCRLLLEKKKRIKGTSYIAVDFYDGKSKERKH